MSFQNGRVSVSGRDADFNDVMVASDTSDYAALRSRVQLLKQEQQVALKAQKSQKDVESFALAQQRAAFEAAIGALQGELAKAQAQAKAHLERSTKVRSTLEREKKALQAALEKANGGVESVSKEWEDKVVTLEARHMAQLAELQRSIAQLSAQQEAERAALRAEKEAACHDMEEWCNAEMEAVKAVSRQEVAEARAQVQEWQERYDLQATRSAATTSQNRELQARVEQLSRELEEERATSTSLAAQLEEAQDAAAAGAQAAEAGMRALRREHADQVRALKGAHRQQLEVIDGRVQGVLAKKDAKLAALTGELALMERRLASLAE